jgi:hypothetical protein
MDILEQLTKLTREELDTVIKQARMLRSIAPTAAQKTVSSMSSLAAGTDPYDYVVAIICDICKARGSDIRDVAAAKRIGTYATFRSAIPHVVDYIKSVAPDRGHQRVILRMGYTYLAEEHSAGLSQMLSMTSQVPAVLCSMFPGYYQAGLMSVVTRRLGSG